MKTAPLARTALFALALLAGGAHAAGPDVPVAASVGADGVQRVTIVGGSYFFRPAQIVARAGRPLEITVSMERGVVPHRFVLEGADGRPLADVELAEQPQTLRLELAAGEYAFHCPNRLLFFKSHRERGMAGVRVGRA